MMRAQVFSFCAVAAFGLAPIATPGVIIADAAGGGDFNEVQEAVDAASDGDTIFVRAGPYAAVDIVDKALTIVSDPAVPATFCKIARVRITSLAATRTVVLSSLTLLGASLGSTDEDRCALLVKNCAGHVRIQRVNAFGNSNALNGNGAPGVIVRGCADVQFMSTSADGGAGGSVGCAITSPVGAGGNGLALETSTCWVHGGIWRGGAGGTGCKQGGAGGTGIAVASGNVVLSGPHAIGGAGGNAVDPVQPMAAIGGAGGNAIFGASGITVTLVNVPTTPGVPGMNLFGQSGPAGAGVAGGAAFPVPPWTDRMIAIVPVAKEGTGINLLIEGAPGELALLFLSATTGPPFPGPQGGAYALGVPLGPFVLGSMNANGQLVLVVTTPALPPGLLGASVYLQSALTGPLGAGWTGPAHATVIDSSL